MVTTKSFTESVETALESAADKIKDVFIPLKEILMEVGNRDVNANLIMEAFDLPMDNLCGFSNDRKHVIIKDDNNYIYANINPDTVKKVNEFYNSFF